MQYPCKYFLPKWYRASCAAQYRALALTLNAAACGSMLRHSKLRTADPCRGTACRGVLLYTVALHAAAW